MAGVKGLFRAARAPFYSGAEVSLFVQKFRQSKTLGFGYSSRQGAKTPSDGRSPSSRVEARGLKKISPFSRNDTLIRPLRLGAFAGDIPALRCGRAAMIILIVASLLLMQTSAPVSFAAANIRIGYPQPSGAMLPIWVMAETKLDQKYGVDLQNIYISGGARLTQTLVTAASIRKFPIPQRSRCARFSASPIIPRRRAPIRETSLTIASLKS